MPTSTVSLSRPQRRGQDKTRPSQLVANVETERYCKARNQRDRYLDFEPVALP